MFTQPICFYQLLRNTFFQFSKYSRNMKNVVKRFQRIYYITHRVLNIFYQFYVKIRSRYYGNTYSEM